MPNRWRILALLFAVRTAMAFQFQSVAALAPFLMRDFGVGLAEIGFSIGLYLAPGIVLALPGGAIGKRFGDKRVVLFGLALMFCGGLIMAFSTSWDLQIFGRLLAGVGGVLLNVLMTKMVTDWFAGKEIATAMGVFVNSWPFGIALALVALPPIATRYGVSTVLLTVAALVLIGQVVLALTYRPPQAVRPEPGTNTGPAGPGWPRPSILLAVIVAGSIWGLYNASLGMIFSFGPSMLAERGWSVASAGSATSIVLWLVVISVPLGGVLADRTGRSGAVLVGGVLAFSAMLLVAARAEAVLPAFIVLGLVSGLSAGPIMSLSARVLTPDTRAMGMGVFYTLFYLVVVIAPWLGGLAANATGHSAVTFDIGAAMLLACCAATLLFRKLTAIKA